MVKWFKYKLDVSFEDIRKAFVNNYNNKLKLFTLCSITLLGLILFHASSIRIGIKLSSIVISLFVIVSRETPKQKLLVGYKGIKMAIEINLK